MSYRYLDSCAQFLFLNATETNEIVTYVHPLSLHDARPVVTGEIEQMPPRFSALKVEGVRAYELARDEEAFELAPRTVVIDRLTLIERSEEHTSELQSLLRISYAVFCLKNKTGRRTGHDT